MNFNLSLGDSLVWTVFFFVLVFFALLTQHRITDGVPIAIRVLVKAAPALLLTGLSWYLQAPTLLTIGFLFCAVGDILLDIPNAFEIGAGVFAVALICLSLAYLDKPLDGRPLMLLSLSNLVLALFVCIWILPKVKHSLRVPGIIYLGLLLVSNVIASTSVVPVFLGSTLWLLSDLSIGVGRHIDGIPANGVTNLGLYVLGLYFIAVGFLNVLT